MMLNERIISMREMFKLKLNKRTMSIINIVENKFENNSLRNFFYSNISRIFALSKSLKY
jgi:hypothetical protein